MFSERDKQIAQLIEFLANDFDGMKVAPQERPELIRYMLGSQVSVGIHREQLPRAELAYVAMATARRIRCWYGERLAEEFERLLWEASKAEAKAQD